MEERRNEILRELDRKGRVKVTDLSKEFGCSEVTIRNDIKAMDIEGLLKSFAYPISSNGSFLKYFSASSMEISLFFTFSSTSLASKTFHLVFVFQLFSFVLTYGTT